MLEIHTHKDFPELFYYQMSCQAAIKIKPNSCFSSNEEVAYQPCFFGKSYIVTYSGLGKYQLCSLISGFSFWIPESGYFLNEIINWKKPFKCCDCDAALKQKKNVNMHIQLVHEEKKPF